MNYDCLSKPCPAGKLTLFSSTVPDTLGKVFEFTAAGLKKTTAGQMVSGTFEIKTFESADALAGLLAKVGTNQAISASLPLLDSESDMIVTKAERSKHPGALARCKEDFGFPTAQPGVIVLDYDPPPGAPALPADQLFALLKTLGVGDGGVVWWCSSSSFIHHGDAEIQGLRGQRLYLLVADLADTERFGEVLSRRLWLAGYGRIAVSTSGSKLIRSVFDTAMFEPARLDFIGGAVCKPPLSQQRGKPLVMSAGGFLDTRAALPDLTDAEAQHYDSLVEDAKAKAEPLAVEMRCQWKEARYNHEVDRLVASGIQPEFAAERAERTLASALGGVLLGDFRITLKGGESVSVAEVLDNREKYHGKITFDPLEPEYQNGKLVGKLYLYGITAHLFSFAHGGVTFALKRQPSFLYVAKHQKAKLVDDLHKLLCNEDDVFMYGGQLVKVNNGQIVMLRKHSLAYYLQSRVSFFSKNAKGEDVPTDLPGDIVEMLVAVAGE
jgi:hypothetical protein